MEWKDIDVKTDNAAKRYDYFVIKVHKLYEEIFSVQERESGHSGRLWNIYVTLSGIITHGDKFFFSKLYPLREIWVYDMVSLYVVEKYFGGNVEVFKQVKYSLMNDWEKAREKIDEYINASNTGRVIPIRDLINRFIMLEKIKINSLCQPFFRHKSFEEYVEEARAYFMSKHDLPPRKLAEFINVEARRLNL